MRDQNEPPNYYAILGVSPDASQNDIRRAYRRLAMQWHPDRNKSPDASRMMQVINEAYEVLSDAERRVEYDRDYFAFLAMKAEEARRNHEEARRSREHQERQRREERARHEADLRRQREEAQRRAQYEREARERKVREQRERRERERIRRQQEERERQEREGGWLDLESENGYLIDEDHFVAEITLRTPIVVPHDLWFAGILFGSSNTVGDLVGITDSGFWSHERYTGNDLQVIDNAYSPNINQGGNVENRLQLIVNGNSGLLFVNGDFMTELDLGFGIHFGTPYAFLGGDQGVLRTRLSNFTIRSLSRVYGPLAGNIAHQPSSSYFDEHQGLTHVADGIIEVEFSNPYTPWQGQWSNGILFRSRNNAFHAIVVQENRRWHDDLRLGVVNTTQGLVEKQSSHVTTTAYDTNHIRIIALGGDGWLFINGTYIDRLDLSGLIGPGFVSAVTNYFTDDGIAGYSTRFKDFTIWSAD